MNKHITNKKKSIDEMSDKMIEDAIKLLKTHPYDIIHSFEVFCKTRLYKECDYKICMRVAMELAVELEKRNVIKFDKKHYRIIK